MVVVSSTVSIHVMCSVVVSTANSRWQCFPSLLTAVFIA